MSSADELYINGQKADRVYFNGEVAHPEVANIAHKPVPTTAVVSEGKTWSISAEYWQGESTRTLETVGGPFGRPYIRKTITSLSHAANSANGHFIIGTNPDVQPPISLTGRGIPVTPGQLYTVSFYLRTSLPTLVRRLTWSYIAADGSKINGGNSSEVTIPQGTWTRLGTSFTPPSNAEAVMLRTHAVGGVPSEIGSTFDASCLMVTEDSTLHPYRDHLSPKLLIT